MKIRRTKVSRKQQMEDALADTGGEPLEGSGFDNELSESDFSESASR